MVAGEVSGDRLGGAIIAALRQRYPDARIRGMAGPAMRAAGCAALADIDELSVMGLAEVVRSYPRLRRLRARLVSEFRARPPDVFVGIDVPDFNLGIARRLHAQGVATVHCVCPQAWAWREGRAARLNRSVDRLLALLPFEAPFFTRHGVATEFIGHPLADALPREPDRAAARAALGLPAGAEVIALLPGSRGQELERLAPLFAVAARALAARDPARRFVACAARPQHLARLHTALAGLPVTIVESQSRQVLTAASVALVASGTVTLEALLCRVPMVVAYRLAPLSYHIIRRMIRVPHIALPNLLAGREIVPEFVQHDATPEALAQALEAWLGDRVRRRAFERDAAQIHGELALGAADRAAAAIATLAAGRHVRGGTPA